MRRFISMLFAMSFCGLGFAQDDEQTLRSLLIHGPNNNTSTVVWQYQPGGGLNLGGAIALPCLLADLSFAPSGEIVFDDPSQLSPDCPAEVVSGEHKLTWETVLIERLGVERLRISETRKSSTCDFAIIEPTPPLDLATACANQDYPRRFRFELQQGGSSGVSGGE